MIRQLKAEYAAKRNKIRKRLRDFRDVWKEDDHRIFAELSFCVCTPQSKAVYCDKAISRIAENKVLFKGDIEHIRAGLRGVRFPNNKARYILENRLIFTKKGVIRIKEKIDINDIVSTRSWLVANVKGIGLKEASHFLRNIGAGEDLAIIDVHVLKNMVRYGMIEDIPKSISEKRYLFLEGLIREFSKKTDIPMADLDLLFWSAETGEIFK
ncbi:MAG: N-glycosylase/DNA lyase [Candidatus Omnitrophota bacterium]|nr:N-glycosylase/DNA lyase [Candidatus Omnitrophota bacterium]